MAKKKNLIRCVFGRKGSGKSFLVKQALQQVEHFIVWDPMCEYHEDDNGAPLFDGARVYTDLNVFVAELAKSERLGRVVLQCPRYQFPALCALVFEIGDHTLVVDEIDQHCTSSHAVEELLELFRRGRHARVNVICIAARPAIVPKDLTYASDDIVYFQTNEPRDLAFIEAKHGSEIAARVASLDAAKREWLRAS